MSQPIHRSLDAEQVTEVLDGIDGAWKQAELGRAQSDAGAGIELQDLRSSMSFPARDLAVTSILVVADIARSRAWYLDVLGATLYGEYGGTSVVLQLGTSWLLLVSGGGPTDDKPGVTLAPPPDPAVLDHLITMRVADCQAVYEELRGRGAEFLTAPVAHGPETRCFFRDPDGHLFEISEYRGPGAT